MDYKNFFIHFLLPLLNLITTYTIYKGEPLTMGDKLKNKVGLKRSTKARLTILEIGSLGSLGVDGKKKKKKT
jgi:hypothetical protein